MASTLAAWQFHGVDSTVKFAVLRQLCSQQYRHAAQFWRARSTSSKVLVGRGPALHLALPLLALFPSHTVLPPRQRVPLTLGYTGTGGACTAIPVCLYTGILVYR